MAAVETLIMRTAAAPAPPRPGSIDARPALPVSAGTDSLWDRAALRRDAIAAAIEGYFERRGIRAWVRKSKPGVYPLFVAVDSWLPVGETDITATIDKSSLTITISVAPYLESPILYKAELRRHAKHFSAEHWELPADEQDEIVAYLLDGGKRPRFFADRVPLALRVIGAFIPLVGHAQKNKLIRAARPRFWTAPTAICVSALAVAGLVALNALNVPSDPNTDFDPTLQYVLAALIAAAGITVAALLTQRRPVVQAIPKQSLRCPRREFRVDSWHVSVPGAGTHFDEFKRRIYGAARSDDDSLEASLEVHQNATPRGFEERERLVLGKGQATLHLHVYAFANDAFVGWDSHLNWHRWAEGGVISSTVQNNRSVEFKALEVGVHLPTEFDLIEADVLTETVHRRVVEQIKAFLKEREIEADLDFKIIRGDRSRALEEGKPDDKSAKKSDRQSRTKAG